MDQTDEEANGEFQDGFGVDDTGTSNSDHAGPVSKTQAIVFRVMRENGAAKDIHLGDDLKDDLDFDSLDIVQIVVDIEEALDIEINVKNLWGIHTVQELLQEVEDSL